ncbi:MAG: cupin domain-containing protein [Bacteroidales bacterium]|nr:cupin domain-containing protein [Candidatus Colimorpha merdihippi]
MIIDFSSIEEKAIPNFKGGDKETHAKIYFDGTNKIMMGRLLPGASIGLHTHETNSEIIFITRGEGQVLYDGQYFPVGEGTTHYCPKGHSHSLINNSQSTLEFTAVIPEQ